MQFREGLRKVQNCLMLKTSKPPPQRYHSTKNSLESCPQHDRSLMTKTCKEYKKKSSRTRHHCVMLNIPKSPSIYNTKYCIISPFKRPQLFSTLPRKNWEHRMGLMSSKLNWIFSLKSSRWISHTIRSADEGTSIERLYSSNTTYQRMF